MKDSSLKNKRILITGINGFIGKALRDRLTSLGAIVFGISKSESFNKQVLNSNVLDYTAVNKFIKDSKIQICFHLASESLVEEGQLNPYETFKVNIGGTLNILESARKNKLEKVIIASTSHVYGKNKVPYIESYMPRPTRPYETSKACADLIAQSYAKSLNLFILIPRFVNIYGPGDLHFQRLIPKTIKSVLEDLPPRMWGGEAIRDYLFIDDAIDAYLLLAKTEIKKVDENGVFNFGGNSIISVEDLIKKIINVSGKKIEIKKVSDKREGEIESQYVSFDKATKLLEWKPKINLDEGLRKTIDWHRQYFKNLHE
ncbi:MAG: NAD-dependent epimerase/dehydratase family protein [Patescibacteria group bacterium]